MHQRVSSSSGICYAAHTLQVGAHRVWMTSQQNDRRLDFTAVGNGLGVRAILMAGVQQLKPLDVKRYLGLRSKFQ